MITLAVISALMRAPLAFRVERVAIVCPASLTANWAAEVEKWLPPSSVPFTSLSSRADMLRFVSTKPLVMIASYDGWVMHRGIFEQYESPCDLLVIDEAHRCTTLASDVHQSLLVVPTARRLLLTGTPMRNDQLHNYYHLLDLASPGSFGSESYFKKQFIDPITSMELGEEHELLGRQTALRLKRRAAFVLYKGDEFLQEFLPPLHELLLVASPSPTQVSLLQQLQSFSDLGMNDLEDGRMILASPSLLTGSRWDVIKRSLALPHCWTVESLCNHSGALRVVHAILQHTTVDDKIVISSYGLEELRQIQVLVRLMRIPGQSTLLEAGTSNRRQTTIDNFNNPNNSTPRILLLPGISGGVGINLTGANRILMLGADWDPANDLQLARRCWRPGQLRDVFVWRVVTCGCLDERVLERGQNKAELRSLMVSAGARGNAAAAARAGLQHDTISRLLFNPDSTTAWMEVPDNHPAWLDTPSVKAAQTCNDKLYFVCIV